MSFCSFRTVWSFFQVQEPILFFVLPLWLFVNCRIKSSILDLFWWWVLWNVFLWWKSDIKLYKIIWIIWSSLRTAFLFCSISSLKMKYAMGYFKNAEFLLCRIHVLTGHLNLLHYLHTCQSSLSSQTTPVHFFGSWLWLHPGRSTACLSNPEQSITHRMSP